MKLQRLLYSLIFLASLAIPALGQGAPPIRMREADGSPSKLGITEIIVTNGSLTISGTKATLTTGGAVPGGNDTYVQFNDAGSLGGDAGLTYNKTTDSLVITSSNANALAVGRQGTTNPVIAIDASAGTSVTGLLFAAGAAGGKINLTVTSSGTDEDFKLRSKGAGRMVFGDDNLAIDNANPHEIRTWTSGLYGFTDNTSANAGTRVAGINKAGSGVVGFVGSSSDGGTFGGTANTPAQITSNQNNYNPGAKAYIQRWSTDASRNVTGLGFSTTSSPSQTHLIINVGTTDIVLTHQDTNSTDINRFLNSSGANITLTANQAALVVYDSGTSRWRAYKMN